jgi:hypothetical protein
MLSPKKRISTRRMPRVAEVLTLHFEADEANAGITHISLPKPLLERLNIDSLQPHFS